MIYFLALVAAIAGFLFGYDENYRGRARLLDKEFPMSPLVGGFMTAAVPLGALVAASVAGRVIDQFGRRKVLMRAAALFAIGALIAAAITAVWMLVAARFSGSGDWLRGVAAPCTLPNRRRSPFVAHWSPPINWRSRSASWFLPDGTGHRGGWRRLACHVRPRRRPACCSSSGWLSCRSRRAGTF